MELPLQSHGLGGKEDWFYERIRQPFCNTVDPLQLLEYLVKENCLTLTDLHEIRKTLRRDGRYLAAAELLRRLRRRPDGIHYLLKACSHPELGLDNLNIYMKTIMDIDFAEWKLLSKEKKPQLPLQFHRFEGIEDNWFYQIIRCTFCNTVDPLQLSEYLVKQNCLTPTDLYEIRDVFKMSGRNFAATALLHRLRRRPDWIQYLLEACSHPELGLDDLKLHINIEIDKDAERKLLYKEEKHEFYRFEDDWFYKRIRNIFGAFVDPLQLSEYLRKLYCLNETDLHEIRKTFRQDGRYLAAAEMLRRLRRRPDWIHYLLMACSHPELGLDNLNIYMKTKMAVWKLLSKEKKPQLPLQFHRFEGIEDNWFYEKICPSFYNILNPLPLTEYLAEQNCLTETDLHEIRKMFREDGRFETVVEVLHRLRRRPDWIYYLLKACSHPELGLYELKKHITIIMENDFAERNWLLKRGKLQLPLETIVFDDSEDNWFYEKIWPTFCNIVDPLPLSEYLVKQNCLTETDLNEIGKKLRQNERFLAAAELLRRLRRRPYGMYYLLKACDLPELRLDDLETHIKIAIESDAAKWKLFFEAMKPQLHSYYPESSDEYMIHTKNIQTGSSGNYYQKSTELSDTLEKTDERVALNWEQLELRVGRLRQPVSFTHKMISPDLKDLFQSVESVFCVPENTEQLSFAANLLKAVHSEEIASEIKLLSDRLDFLDCSMVFGDEDPGTICALDVDIVFNKDHLRVVKRDPIQWFNTSLLKSERILKVILVHSRSLRVVETKLQVYKEYEMLFRSKTLHLQHEYEDFDEIAKKSANAKVSLFQRTIRSLEESIPSENLAVIVSKAANHSLSKLNVREICCNEFIKDGENVGTVQSNSYTCRLFSTVRRIKRMLVTNTLRKICKSLGLEICKEIMCLIQSKIGTMYLYIYEDQIQLNVEIPDTLIERITVETTSFLISICDPILFAAGSFIRTFVFSVDVNSLIWRREVADEIFLMISKHQKDIVKKALLLVENACKKTTEDLKNLDRSLEKWKENIECMDIIELVSIWEKREAMKNISGLGSHRSVLNLIAGIKNDKPTLKVFLSIDDQDAISFIKDHPEIPKDTVFEFVVVKSNKEQKDPAKMKNYSSYPIEKNVREMLSKTIKNQGERIYANHSSIVGLGIGSMDCKGQIKPCIIIYCLDKDLVPFGEKPLPKTLEGFCCDIREDFIMFGACFDCHEIAHPNPGCCIGLPSNGIGSAGFLAKTNESGMETSGFVTAAHVAAENWTELYFKKSLLSKLEVGQYNYEIVHPLLPNDNSGQIVGKVIDSYCGNWGPEDIGIDAAFVQNYKEDKTAYREIQPADESELDYGDQLIVLKRGGTTGQTFGRLVDGSYTPCINLHLDTMAWKCGAFFYFNECFAVKDISAPFFNPGDSGSGVFLTENEIPTKPLGIAFARLNDERITCVCRIDQVAKAFKLRLYENVEPMET